MSKSQATPAEIMIRKIERGVTNKTIAATLGVTEQAVGFVFQGRSRSPRLRAAIASALGWPERRIWPIVQDVISN